MFKPLSAGLFACVFASAAEASCLPVDRLIERDQAYEEAMRSGNAAYLDELLAPDYVWVHSLASSIDSKADVLARARSGKVVHKSRTTSEVKAHVLGATVVLRGLATVEQWNPDGKTWKVNRYQFMRTYVGEGGTCKLLGVHTQNLSPAPPPR